MILQARDVGELAIEQMRSPIEGKVTRVFRRSAYVETGQGLILLLQGGLRSPITVNLGTEVNIEGLLAPGSSCCLGEETMRFDAFSIEKDGAAVYRSSLLDGLEIDIAAGRELARGAAALRLLYGVSPASLDLVGSDQFRGFIASAIRPLCRGESKAAYSTRNYLPLIGMGSGFTPAGDDFVSGFVAAFNFVARSLGWMEIRLPWRDIAVRTVPESARLIDYAQRGQADEDLSRLIISATVGDHTSFWNSLLDVAQRGHTSGIDLSLGVILASASLAGALGGGDSAERVLHALESRTL